MFFGFFSVVLHGAAVETVLELERLLILDSFVTEFTLFLEFVLGVFLGLVGARQA